MKKVLFSLVALAALTACSHKNDHHDHHASHEKRKAKAVLHVNQKNLKGVVEFAEKDGIITVTTKVDGLSVGAHGFHVHEFGDCSKSDFTSAGGHFNPHKTAHGAHGAKESHAGDFGNLVAGKDFKAHTTFTAKGITLGEGANSIVGKAIIIHADPDDGVTQPTGNAGGRVACGVVELL